VPSNAARPGRRRLLRLVGVGVVGLAVGIGATLAVHGLGGRSGRAASVQRLDLPAAGAARPAPAGGKVGPLRAGTARAAVRRFIQAGAGGDLAAAYGLLDRAGRRRYRRWPASSGPRPTGPRSPPSGSGPRAAPATARPR
jgi:hypothetical protein